MSALGAASLDGGLKALYLRPVCKAPNRIQSSGKRFVFADDYQRFAGNPWTVLVLLDERGVVGLALTYIEKASEYRENSNMSPGLHVGWAE